MVHPEGLHLLVVRSIIEITPTGSDLPLFLKYSHLQMSKGPIIINEQAFEVALAQKSKIIGAVP